MKINPACIPVVFVIIDTQALQRITFFCFVFLSNLKESQVIQHERANKSWLRIPLEIQEQAFTVLGQS